MAYYAALVSIVELLKEIIDSQSHQFSDLRLGLDQIHASLYREFSLLQLLVENHLPKDLDEASVDILETRIRTAAYQAQDIIESRISDLTEESGAFTFAKTAWRAHKEDLQKVQEEVNSIVEELKRMKMRGRPTREDTHMQTIKAKLCEKSTKLEVLSISGTGGTGKTTLARNLFDDELIGETFDCLAWVTVSQEYHLRKVVLGIGNSMNIIDEKLSREGVGVLKDHIYQHLFGRRYLIVMDDIWKINFWDEVKTIFPNNCNGSRIMITTRESNVAAYASSPDFFHKMQPFDENQSWNLFCEKVFCPPELEDIGRLIVKICGGLPLAIVVVAGLLSKVNKTRQKWEEIGMGLRSGAIENDDHLSNILSLSYNLLPDHLKPCFLYLGGFPEDDEIPVTKLIKLWVAEGFLQPAQDQELEKLAEQYLEDLASRNLVLLTKKGSEGKFKCCSIHDVVSDFCLENARNEKFLDKSENGTIGNVRRLYIPPGSYFPDRNVYDHHISHISHVRSVLFFGYSWEDIESYLSEFKLLRVLDAVSMEFEIFPVEVVELFHLRYLALECIECLMPPSIFKLQNLQTLIIHGTMLLPPEIWRMSQLRHVMIGKMTLPPIPHEEDRVSPLKRLQTLHTVTDFVFTRATTEMIPGLKKLTVLIGADEPCETWKKFGLNELVHLRKLEALRINFDVLSSEMDDVMPLPKSFTFPSNLRKLTLEGCRLPWTDMTAVGGLSHLQVLKLRWNSFVREEWEPKEEQFPRLKFLLMESLSDLKFWRAKSTHFHSLEQLHIKHCSELEEIPSEIGEISTLQLVEVHSCSKALESALKIQKDQGERRKDVLQVRVYG